MFERVMEKYADENKFIQPIEVACCSCTGSVWLSRAYVNERGYLYCATCLEEERAIAMSLYNK